MKRLVLSMVIALAAACDPCGPGDVCAFAGSGIAGFGGDDGPATDADFYMPMDVVFGPDQAAYVVDWNNHRVRVVQPDGTVKTIAGSGELGDDVALTLESSFNHPTSALFDHEGRLLVAAWHNSRVKRIDLKTNNVENICGSGKRAYSGDGGPAAKADLDLPTAIALNSNGELYILDQANQLIRKVDAGGSIQRVAGQCIAGACNAGEEPVACPNSGKVACVQANPDACTTPCLGAFAGDGEDALHSRLAMPVGQAADPGGRLVFDKDDTLYFADTKNHRIRRITKDGKISTVAGVGTAGFAGDGAAATAAQINKPIDVEIGPDGDVYFADTGNSCVRAFKPGGNIRTVAGQCTVRGADGDGGPALEATFDHPYGIAFDQAGNLYVADTLNSRIRKVMLAKQ